MDICSSRFHGDGWNDQWVFVGLVSKGMEPWESVASRIKVVTVIQFPSQQHSWRSKISIINKWMRHLISLWLYYLFKTSHSVKSLNKSKILSLLYHLSDLMTIHWHGKGHSLGSISLLNSFNMDMLLICKLKLALRVCILCRSPCEANWGFLTCEVYSLRCISIVTNLWSLWAIKWALNRGWSHGYWRRKEMHEWDGSSRKVSVLCSLFFWVVLKAGGTHNVDYAAQEILKRLAKIDSANLSGISLTGRRCWSIGIGRNSFTTTKVTAVTNTVLALAYS